MVRNVNDMTMAARSISEKVITKRFINMVAKFNEELVSLAKETEEYPPTLYEDYFTSFTLSDVRVEGDEFVYNYDGSESRDPIFRMLEEDEIEDDEDDYFSYVEEIKRDIKFWRSCIRRARRYWAMSCEELEAKEEFYLNGESNEED